MDKRLFLIDAYTLIYRAYYSFINNPRKNSKGLNTSAAFGFTNALYEVIEKQQPTHIAVVFDPETPTFRHEIYEEYKAQRPPTPEDIKTNLPYIKQVVSGFRIPILQVDYYEADDVIGTIAEKAQKQGFKVYMMTSDKDFGQLVDDKIYMFKPKRSGGNAEIWTREDIISRYGIEDPRQIIDILAMWGDKSDNIPGIPGVGEKTAIKYIQKFGSLEGLYNNLENLKGKQKQKVHENKEQAFLAKKLVTIKTDAPITFNPEELKLTEPDTEALKQVFDELEFRSIEKRVLGDTSISASQGDLFNQGSKEEPATEEKSQKEEETYKNIETVDHNYRIMDSEENVKQLTEKLLAVDSFCFDTETTDTNPYNAELVGISFSFAAGEGYYVPCPPEQEKTQHLIEILRPVFESGNKEIIAHNINYDILVLDNYNIQVRGTFFDTIIAHYLLHPEYEHNMDFVARQYLQYDPVPIENLIGGKGKKQLSMRQISPDTVAEYAVEDADVTWQLKPLLENAMKKSGVYSVFQNIETPLIDVLLAMERFGVKIDPQALYTYVDELKNKIAKKEKEIYSQAGVEFNINSPKQLGEVLFERLKIVQKPKRTRTKQYATGEQELQKLANKHPIVPLILEHRSLVKLLNTYVEPLPQFIHKRSGKIHTIYNQARAATGRLSSTNPNIQNIPIREKEGRRIREAFIPSADDRLLLSADYSQIELRLMAHLSGDEHLIEAFTDNIDIHALTASKIYKMPVTDITRNMRSKAKSANFGIIYGISAFGLSQNLNISRSEAKQLIDGYFASYPKVKEYMDNSISEARKNGYVETIKGRKRYLPDINSRNAVVRGVAERNAINAPIQGSAADIIKLAMIDIHNELQKRSMQSKMTLQVHDELIFDVPEEEADILKELLTQKMENVVSLRVPLTIDTGTGKNWLAAH